MKTYKSFHGETAISDIGLELRKIIKTEKTAFKILTGYGSSSGNAKSKKAALKCLANMKKEGLIKGYFPGEVKTQLLMSDSPYLAAKEQYYHMVKGDFDYGNDGIIFVFLQ